MGTAGSIISMLLSLLKNKVPQLSIKGNMLDIDITEILLKLFPSEAAAILDEAQVHILGLKPSFLHLGIRKA